MTFPKDRFDDIPASLDRRGAHRAPRSRGDKIASWLWGLAAVVVLVIIGVVGMFVIENIVTFEQEAEPTPTATEEAPVEEPPVVAQQDPNIPVTVLNGTSLAGVAGNTGDLLAGQGWNVVSRDDADSEDYTETTVFYGDAADEAAALALVEALGGGSIALDPARAAPGSIVIIVGLDLAQ